MINDKFPNRAVVVVLQFPGYLLLNFFYKDIIIIQFSLSTNSMKCISNMLTQLYHDII